MPITTKHYQTTNGIKLLSIDVPGSTVFYSKFIFRAGDRQVPDQQTKAQVAHIMEHMAGNVIGYRSKGTFDSQFRRNGAYRNASTSNEFMTYVNRCADFDWQHTLSMQIDMLSHPNFTAESLTTEKANVHTELAGHLSDPQWNTDFMADYLMGNNDLPLPQQIATIDNATLDDIISFHNRTHTLSNLQVIVAGDLADTGNQIVDLIDTLQLPTGWQLPIKRVALHPAPGFLEYRDQTPTVSLYYPIVLPRLVSIREEQVLNVLITMLTGNMGSPIFGAVRAQGLAYNARLSYFTEKYHTYLVFRTKAPANNLAKICQIATSELSKVKQGQIDHVLFEAAKSSAAGRMRMGFETISSLADYISGRYLINDELIDIDQLTEIINSVTIDEAVKLFNEFVTTGAWTFGLYGTAQTELVDQLQDELNKLF